MITTKNVAHIRSAFVLGVVFSFLTAFSCSAVELKLIGQVESLYRNRISLRILEILSPSATETAKIPLAVGNRVSFNLPQAEAKKHKRPIGFDSVIEVTLDGNVTTEYEQSQTEPPDESASATAPGTGLIWTARRVERVKNPRKYLEPDKEEKKGKRKKRDRKEKEPPQIWTQDEAVRGLVLARKNRLFIKEDSLRPRDLGLDVIQPEWAEKLQPLVGKRVVVFGTTHRVTVSSGTIEIQNIMKISADEGRKR